MSIHIFNEICFSNTEMFNTVAPLDFTILIIINNDNNNNFITVSYIDYY